MTLLTLQNVNKAFVMNEVLKDIDLTLPEGGKLGLVGVNGSGKSTLLRLIAGEDMPDSGTISLIKGAKVGYLSQHADIKSDYTVTQELSRVFDDLFRMETRLREMEQLMSRGEDLAEQYARLTQRYEDAGGYEKESRIQGVLAGLSFAKDRRDMPSRLLSGGEQTRLCLARLLLRQPDLLLLDEPTNHLDLPATAWLEDTLKKYKGAVIVVSHDRYFLNSVCSQMAELRQGHVTQYSCGYDEFEKRRDARLRQQIKDYELQQETIKREEEIIRRYRSFNREKSIKAAESREKRLEKIERLEKPVSDRHVRFSFSCRRRTGDDVLMVKGLKKSFDGRPLFENIDLHLKSGDRVAIIGANGIGKTTLLNIIMGREARDGGSVIFGANVDAGYYDQKQADLHPEKDILSEVWDDFPLLEPGEVRSALGLFLLTGEEVFRQVGTLSGGERGRVELSKLMLRHDNLLILDEPTNHLDMDSRQVLEDALTDYEGTILTVSHDRWFINRVATRVAEMTPEGLRLYEGNYDSYLEKKQEMARLLSSPAASGETRTQMIKQQKKERLSKEQERQRRVRLKQLEAEIEKLEKDLSALEAELGKSETWQDHQYGMEVQARHDALKLELDGKYDEWTLLSEEE
ncbi:MAG: ABC-F family ATP-binding cassette domain-containing protein [Clostridiales bacterium]|nr:ABC-F family ATP-binding cassette domain-containing protein [Clostridiales bacterium]